MSAKMYDLLDEIREYIAECGVPDPRESAWLGTIYSGPDSREAIGVSNAAWRVLKGTRLENFVEKDDC